MTDNSPLQRLAVIAAEVRQLQQLCYQTGNTAALDELARLMRKIGDLQLRIAQAAADHAETDAMERQFGPRIRTSLED